MSAFGNDKIKVSYSQMWKWGEFSLMIIKLEKNKLSIPEDILNSLGLIEGQELDIQIKDNQIVITPVSEELKLALEAREEYEEYIKDPQKYKAYTDVEELLKDLKS